MKLSIFSSEQYNFHLEDDEELSYAAVNMSTITCAVSRQRTHDTDTVSEKDRDAKTRVCMYVGKEIEAPRIQLYNIRRKGGYLKTRFLYDKSLANSIDVVC